MRLIAQPFRIAGVRIDALTQQEAALAILHGNGPMSVHLCNAYTIALADADPGYRHVLNRGTLNLPDGSPVAWVGRNLCKAAVTGPVPGPDLFVRCLRDGIEAGTRHYLFGSTADVLAQLEESISTTIPGAVIVGREAPPFGDLTDQQLVDGVVRMVAVGADVVWVGLGTPKQDHVVERLRELGPHKYIAVGAAFDFVAGTKTRAPSWVSRIGFEWLFRLVSEPRRLWRRYLFGNLRFVIAAVRSARPSA